MTTIRERNSYNRNAEGYLDLTASKALDKIEREMRALGNWRREPQIAIQTDKPVKYRLTWKAQA